MNHTAKHLLSFLILFGALLYAGPALAQCVKPVDKAECTPLKGMRLVGFRIDMPENRAPLGITKAALRDSTLYTIERLIPEIRVEESPERAPQIHVLVSYLGKNPDAAPLHFRVALRKITTREGQPAWDSTWLTSYVISATSENPANEIMNSLKESLRRFAADWRKANPNHSSKNTAPQQ
jgi:hypothetical protein